MRANIGFRAMDCLGNVHVEAFHDTFLHLLSTYNDGEFLVECPLPLGEVKYDDGCIRVILFHCPSDWEGS